MASAEDARYRLQLAEGFLNEAQEDIRLTGWRSCVDNSQLAAENSAKAVLTLIGPVGRTHVAADLLRKAFQSGKFPSRVSSDVSRLIQLTDQLGWDVHMDSDYEDEVERRTPWELFDETSAQQALSTAEYLGM